MASNVKLGSAAVSVREIDNTSQTAVQPSGIPAGIVGTANRGPAFVPVTVGLKSDYELIFGKSDGIKFGPLAVYEWLRNAQAVTYLRVMGAGNAAARDTTTKPGRVVNGGFVVGQQEPDANSGLLVGNPYANAGGPLGRTYFLGCFMSESLGSSIFSSASIQGPNSNAGGLTNEAVPILRGVLLAPSGVILKISGSITGDETSNNGAPPSTFVATDTAPYGRSNGSVNLTNGQQTFVMLLNGHMGTDPRYPNVLTASFDVTAPNYFANVFNQDPLNIQQAGHYLYAFWDIHPALAVVTGTNRIGDAYAAGGATSFSPGLEFSVLLLSGSQARDVGTATAPDYENWQDRFRSARTPWIISQKLGGKQKNLFRLWSLDAGTGTASKIKISIENIAPSTDSRDPYGTFDVVVRDWNDVDTAPSILEQFRGCSLNPSADRYIAKAIGDLNAYYDFDRAPTSQKLVVDGNYPNVSTYVRVEVDTGVTDGFTDPTAMPVGFRGPAHLITSGTAPLMTRATWQSAMSTGSAQSMMEPPVPYRLNINQGSGAKALPNPSLYWGFQQDQISSVTDPNSTTVKSAGAVAYTKYFPDFMTTYMNFMYADTVGAADTLANGIVDVDRFCNNQFTLENIQVVTGSDTFADPQKWSSSQYVRQGNIPTVDSAKTRAVTISDFTQPNRKYLKFTTFLQGGFDGVDPFNYELSNLTNAAIVQEMADPNRGAANNPTTTAYQKAVDILKEKTDTDIQLLAIPGIREAIVTDRAVDAVQTRFDAMYIMDVDEYDTNGSLVTGSAQIPSVTNTVTNFKDRALNSSFAAAYYPDVVITDPNTNSNVMCPPSVAVLGAFSKNDAVAYPWFAPAGFTRGALDTTLEAKVKLSKDSADLLYDANVNPLISFPGNTPVGTQAQGGVVVWGQRTLQAFASSLDRVNVRRLLISVRRQIRDVANTFIFEPNKESTLLRFQSAVEPILNKVKSNFGVEQYLVKIDTTTTTQADVDNNTIKGRIFLVPTRAIEYVSLDFIINNAGAAIQ